MEPPAQVVACVHKLSATLHTVVAYQPGNRFWPFQWAEMGIFPSELGNGLCVSIWLGINLDLYCG